MKKIILLFLIMVFITNSTSGEEVYFADAVLENAVRDVMPWLEEWEPITSSDMLKLSPVGEGGSLLAIGGMGISDLTGLDYAIHLRSLWAANNDINDTFPLAGLSKLTF